MAHWLRPVARVVTIAFGTEGAHRLLATAHAQESGQWVVGQVVKLDTASKKLTIRAIMGFQELRARKGELLENVKVGDQVRLQVGPDGTEKVITALEVIR
jgi:hypothetical protein